MPWIILMASLGAAALVAAGETVLDGTFSPGNSPGCINHAGNVTLSSTLTLTIEIGGTDPCNEFDRLLVAQTLTIEGATLKIVLINDFNPDPGDDFDIIDWNTLDGEFGNIDTNGAVLQSGTAWSFEHLYVDGTVAVAGDAAIVPLPGWSLLLLAGVIAAVRARLDKLREPSNRQAVR